MWSSGGGAAPLACSELQSKALVPQDMEMGPPQLGIPGFEGISGSRPRWTGLGAAWLGGSVPAQVRELELGDL